jgi:hypothetical protein
MGVFKVYIAYFGPEKSLILSRALSKLVPCTCALSELSPFVSETQVYFITFSMKDWLPTANSSSDFLQI